MKAVGQRDMSVQKVMHQILSLKLFSSSFQAVTASLDGTRKINVQHDTVLTEPSLLNLYADRKSLKSKSVNSVLQYSFLHFVSLYTMKKAALKSEQHQLL